MKKTHPVWATLILVVVASMGVGLMPGVSAGGFGHTSCHGYNLAGNVTSRGFAAVLP
jgi:hypothetical protein